MIEYLPLVAIATILLAVYLKWQEGKKKLAFLKNGRIEK
jgi:hypothetical protein